VFYFTGIEKCDRENGNGFLKKWQVFPGMGGRYIPECPAGISRNQWQVTAGICNLLRDNDLCCPKNTKLCLTITIQDYIFII